VLYLLGKIAFLPCLYAAFMVVFALPVRQIWAELLAQQCALTYAMFLYCVEHTYEGVYRVPKAEFNRTAAGLLGSSYLSMPWWWQWATIGVEYHHFHHQNARLPCYRMRECEAAAPPGLWDEAGIRKLGACEGFRALILSLWDPDQRRYVPLPEWSWLDRLLAPELYSKEASGKLL
jgi:omega-6 fatty acid desaturase (delta-12 desaturase)